MPYSRQLNEAGYAVIADMVDGAELGGGTARRAAVAAMTPVSYADVLLGAAGTRQRIPGRSRA
jgi:hypothetical protein